MSEDQKKKIFQESFEDFPFRFTGRAAENLGELFSNKRASQFENLDCKRDFLGSAGVHIDPYGNVFSGTCSGIVVGNVNEMPLDKIWETKDYSKSEPLKSLFEGGPWLLSQIAAKEDFKKDRFYSSKCHFCSQLRQFFFDKGQFRLIIAPAVCYNSSR